MFVIAEQRQDAPAARACWRMGQRNASRARRQTSLIRSGISVSAASAPLGVQSGGNAGGQMIGIQRQQDGGRLEVVQRRAGFRQFL